MLNTSVDTFIYCFISLQKEPYFPSSQGKLHHKKFGTGMSGALPPLEDCYEHFVEKHEHTNCFKRCCFHTGGTLAAMVKTGALL